MYLISDLAKKAHVTVDAIRFYQKKGLLEPVWRAENGYYYYAQTALARLVFIKNCRNLEMSLLEIQQLLALLQDPQRCCQTVNDLVAQHIAMLDEKILKFQKFRDQLQHINDACQASGTIASCAILKHFEREES